MGTLDTTFTSEQFSKGPTRLGQEFSRESQLIPTVLNTLTTKETSIFKSSLMELLPAVKKFSLLARRNFVSVFFPVFCFGSIILDWRRTQRYKASLKAAASADTTDFKDCHHDVWFHPPRGDD